MFSTEISPQLKVDSQLEQTLVFVAFINIKVILLKFVRIKVNKKNRNCLTFVAIENLNNEIVIFKICADIAY
ncbi:hypothetical protein D3C87_2031240 [compost metagenome]